MHQHLPVPRLLCTLGLCLALNACSEPPTIPSPGEPAKVTQAPSPNDTTIRTHDSEWARVARQDIPGFAGFYKNRAGELELMLADTAGSDTKRQAFDRVFSSIHGPDGTRLRIGRISRVDFDFDVLYRAHQVLMYTRGAPNTLSTIDIDEVRNRLVVSVWPASAIGEMRDWLRRIGIADRMVIVDAKERVHGADCSPTDNVITNCQRPTTGGLGITNAAGAQCSITVNAVITENVGSTLPYNGFITAGHCASQPGAMVAEPFYQGGAYVGYKTKDGATGYFACTLSTIGCRFSDALAAAYTPGLANDLGRIIGMQYPDQPDLSLAEQILPQYYGDYISSAPRDLSGDYIGATVFKVGARTGETHGTIVATAVDVRLNNGLGYLSQVAVAGTGTNNVADEGDSGAPVFERVGGAQLVGVLMGITGDRQRYYYSAWGNVTNELVGRPRAPFPYGAIQVMP